MMKRHAAAIIKLFIIALGFPISSKAEVFSAVEEMKPLLNTEGEIVKTLDKYLQAEEERLENVRKLKSEYERLYKSAMTNVESFLSNPVNAFVLLKRLTSDWKNLAPLIEGAYSKAVIQNVTNQGWLFPTREDLNGAAAAIFRLQETYLLEASKLADGEIKGAAKALELSATDCYELGFQAHTAEDHHHATLWLHEALIRMDGNETGVINKSSTMEPLAYNAFMLGEVQRAVDLAKEIIRIDPGHPRVQHHLSYYQAHLPRPGTNLTPPGGYKKNKMPHTPEQMFNVKEMYGYDNLCRGESLKSHWEESQLYCHYTRGNNKYLLLQPVKTEILNLDPWIVMYYDVVSDKDIEIFKNLAMPKLYRATVQNRNTGLLETAPYRVSKSAWLFDKDHPRVLHASKMIEEITNLESDTAEELQIVNYGLGGHYEPHYDFRRDGEAQGPVDKASGNRIATWIYYFSDVEAGGGTAFPIFGTSVKPRKGAAAFWYNLFKSGNGDLRTMHGGCPVLAGSKWVANKWFREKGQEFRRRCSLDPYE